MTAMAASFPTSRPRRLRRTPAIRDLVAETVVRTGDLVAPLFVREGIAEPVPIGSLPGVVQHTRESLRKEVGELANLGVRAVILFGVPATKDRRRQPGLRPGRHRAAGARRPARRPRRRRGADGRPVRRRVHRPRPLRRARRRRQRRQRRHARRVRPGGGGPGRRRRPRRRPERDDGRPGRPHPRRPRRRRARRHGHPRLLGEVRQRAVRAVPRRGRRHGSSAGAIAGGTSRTGATGARRCARSSPTSTRVPTW